MSYGCTEEVVNRNKGKRRLWILLKRIFGSHYGEARVTLWSDICKEKKRWKEADVVDEKYKGTVRIRLQTDC